MNRGLFTLLCLLFLLSPLIAQNNFWEEAPGPYGGSLGVRPTNSNLVYATYYKNSVGSIYRSEDYGEHWQSFNVPILDSSAYDEVLLIGYSGKFYKIVYSLSGGNAIRKLYLSTDEGSTWALINSDLPVYSFSIAPSGVLFGVDFSDRLYRSSNDGASWQLNYSPNFLLSYISFSLSYTPNGRMLLSGHQLDNGFAVSSNGGLGWVEGELPSFFTVPYLVSSGTIFGVSDFGEPDLYRSVDIGATWDTITFALSAGEYLGSILDLNNGRILLSTSSHIYFSDNDGLNWQLMPDSPEHPPGLLLDFPLPNGDILGMRNGSLFRSNDDGVSWSFSAYGVNRADTKQLAFLTDSLQMAVTHIGLWKTENAGTTWERLLPDSSNIFVYSRRPLAVLNQDSFMVSLGKELWVSANGGQSFSNVTPNGGLTWGHIFPASGKYLFCSGTSGVARSGDMGNSWTTVIPNAGISLLTQQPSGGLFAFSIPLDQDYPRTLWRSTDEGATWTQITTLAIPPSQRRALHADNSGKIYVTGYFDHSMKLAVSADNGATWEYKIIPDIYAFDEFMVVNDIGRIFMSGGDDIQILTSADGGESWYYLPIYSDNTSLLNGLEISPSGLLYIVPSSGTLYRSTSSTEIGAYITGHVRKDADAECSTPDAQEPLKNWVVEIAGELDFFASTNAEGRYTFFVDTGVYEVSVRTPQMLWWSICDSTQIVASDSLFSIDTVDFTALALADCPLMSVSVAAPFLRRCFDNTIFVQYCNQGSEIADSAWVDIYLDPYLTFVSSGQPHNSLGNNVVRFLLGDVESGECGQFSLVAHIDCDSTVLGQTHCITAHAYPDTLCTTVPNWSGATIEAEVECQDTSVQFHLRNTGNAPSEMLDYIIIEDDVVLMSGERQYDSGETLTLDRPANGRTWRIESQQEPGHPFSNVAVAFAEGCGGFESLGFINRFNVNTFQPSWNRICLENIGAYDPNDKQGFPLGFGAEHRIRPGQELDYMIRFQNTGTDTAFNIVIRDTLSVWLDPASVRPGAASHPYTWELSGQGVLSFTFANILLPDSNTNLAASQGFVTFKINQQPDVPLPTQIFNSAAIYFDFNLPVITNQTLHTVGVDYISSTNSPTDFRKQSKVTVSPNPVAESAVFQLKEGIFNQHRIIVADVFGRKVREVNASGKQQVFQRKGLPPGTYFFRVEDAKGRFVDSGKIILK